jgi:hypothetical protein
VLPDAVANDPERLARFEREAKALAALNHPNVAQNLCRRRWRDRDGVDSRHHAARTSPN